jgi:hypothetical protein
MPKLAIERRSLLGLMFCCVTDAFGDAELFDELSGRCKPLSAWTINGEYSTIEVRAGNTGDIS